MSDPLKTKFVPPPCRCGATRLARSLRVRPEHREDCRLYRWQQLTNAAHRLGVAAAEFDEAKERYAGGAQ